MNAAAEPGTRGNAAAWRQAIRWMRVAYDAMEGAEAALEPIGDPSWGMTDADAEDGLESIHEHRETLRLLLEHAERLAKDVP